MNQPKISIIVPFYNLELYVERCLNSLINQTFSEIEILCINDGSTDNTLNILESFAKTDHRIKIITQKNAGVSSARNTGIKNAKGAFLLFIDGDDYIELNACELLYQKAYETDADMICFWRRFIYGNNKIKNILPDKISLLGQPFNFNENISKTFCDLFGCFMCDRLYKKKFLISHNIYFNETLSWREDNIFVYNCYFTNPKILITNYILYNYCISTTNSLSKVSGEEKITKMFNNFNCINNLCNQYKISSNDLSKIYIINSFLLALACGSFFRDLYRSKSKKECLKTIIPLLKHFKNLDKKYLKDMKGYKKFRIYYLFLIKFHLCYIYCFLIYPIIKLINQLYIIYFGNKTTNMTKI